MTCTEREAGGLKENSGSMERKEDMCLVLRLDSEKREEKVKIQGEKSRYK